MSYVLSYGGASLDSIWLVMRVACADADFAWVRTLKQEACEALAYEEDDYELDALRQQLESRELCSLQFQTNPPVSLLAGIYAPRFCGGALNVWRCVMEGTEANIARLYDQCLETVGLSYVSLSHDDEPDLTGDDITAQTFPWRDWRLQRAAVRKPNGEWDERKGPAT